MITQSIKTNIVIVFSLLLAITSSWFLASRSQTVTTNTTNNSATRIVSGYAAFTEILVSIGVADRIVAATSSDAKTLHIPSIGSHMRPDIEAIIAAHPDLIILSSRRPELVEVLQNKMAGTEAFIVAEYPHTVDGTLSFIKRLGDLTDHQDQAKAIIDQAEALLAPIAQAVSRIPEEQRPVVFLEVRNAPSLLTCGKDSVAYDIIRRAGGRPTCNLPGSVVHTDIEDLIVDNPDFYIQQYGAMNNNPSPPSHHQVIGKLLCVRQGAVLKMDEKLISRPGPRVAEAVMKIYEELYNGKL